MWFFSKISRMPFQCFQKIAKAQQQTDTSGSRLHRPPVQRTIHNPVVPPVPLGSWVPRESPNCLAPKLYTLCLESQPFL